MSADSRFIHALTRGCLTTRTAALTCLAACLGTVGPAVLRAQGTTATVATPAATDTSTEVRRPSAPDPAIMATVQRLFDGMRAGDSAMVRSVFHPQLRMLSAARGPDGKLRLSVQASADGFVRAVGTPHPAVWDERIWNEKVEVDGPIASVWVDYAFLAGETLSHCGVDHFLLVRGDDGAWSIISLADTRRTDGCTTGPAGGR